MLKKILVLLLTSFIGLSAFATDGHNFKIKINNYEEQELFLAYHLGDKQYILDTASVGKDGFFTFLGDEPLDCGLYLVVMKPDNNFFQLLINDSEQHFTLTTDKDDLVGKAKIKHSLDNEIFFEYLDFLNKKGPQAQSISEGMAKESDEEKKKVFEKSLEKLNEEVKFYQEKIMKEHPETLTALIIRSTIQPEIPSFEGTDDEQRTKRWRYMQKHFFDNIDLTNPCILRMPFLFQKIDDYINKLQVQHPDTLAKAIEYVLDQMEPAPETFKYYVIHFLNHYAQSKIVGMDAVYVELADKYYATGKTPWVDEEQLEKILDNVKKLKPILIGKIAPDLRLEKRGGGQIRLHEVKSEYTVLYFWRYDCGHCKKSSPYMKKFYENFKDKGVEIVAICTKQKDELPKCWEYVEEKGIADWLHTYDPYYWAMKLYNIKSTPQIFVLDKNKEIITKRIGAEQLEEVMDKIIEMKKKQEMQEMKE